MREHVHEKSVSEVRLADHDGLLEMTPGTMSNQQLVEAIALAGLAVYEFGECPCILNTLKIEAMGRLTNHWGHRNQL